MIKGITISILLTISSYITENKKSVEKDAFDVKLKKVIELTIKDLEKNQLFAKDSLPKS